MSIKKGCIKELTVAKKEIDIDLLAKSFLDKCKSLEKIRVAVVYPCSEDALKGAVESAEFGLIEPVLIGPKNKITKLADECQIEISKYEIIDEPDAESSVRKAIELVHEKLADSIMKGSLHTDELMKEVVNKASGL